MQYRHDVLWRRVLGQNVSQIHNTYTLDLLNIKFSQAASRSGVGGPRNIFWTPEALFQVVSWYSTTPACMSGAIHFHQFISKLTPDWRLNRKFLVRCFIVAEDNNHYQDRCCQNWDGDRTYKYEKVPSAENWSFAASRRDMLTWEVEVSVHWALNLLIGQ